MDSVAQLKRCGKCREMLPLDAFNKSKARWDGLTPECRECRRVMLAERRAKRITKVCIECGQAFEDRNGEGQLCGPCKRVRHKRFFPPAMAVCQQCGRDYQPGRVDRQYCSLACKRAGLRGKPNASRGRKYPSKQRATTHTCPSCGATFRGVKDTQRRAQVYCSHACYLRNRHISHFEDRVLSMIEAAGIPVERQAKRGRWCFDGALVGSSILVEADGKYWHSPPAVQERDARKDAWCLANGYILLRVKELEFYRDPVGAVAPILGAFRAEAEGIGPIVRVSDG